MLSFRRVSVSQLFSYIMRKGKALVACGNLHVGWCSLSVVDNFPAVWLQQTRIGLSLFDIQGLGYLKESVSYSPP